MNYTAYVQWWRYMPTRSSIYINAPKARPNGWKTLNTVTTSSEQFHDMRPRQHYHSHAKGTLVTDERFEAVLNVEFTTYDYKLNTNTLSDETNTPLPAHL